MHDTTVDPHLTDAEIFSLAAPASGEPEALPAHLLRCPDCSRGLHEWKAALRAIGHDEVAELDRRTPGEWRQAEDATMSAIRRAGKPGGSRRAVRWAVGIAASLLLVALAMPRRGGPEALAVPGPDQSAALSPADAEDDALLREAADLARGGDNHDDLALEESL
jgi:hypothetical protein